jgi:hypothetical protein
MSHDHSKPIKKLLPGSLQYQRHSKITLTMQNFGFFAQDLFTLLTKQTLANRFTEHQSINILTSASVSLRKRHSRRWQQRNDKKLG